jgi:manganese/zinc/iron transport system permease protein
MIVLVAGAFFVLSALFGPARGWIPRQRALRRLNARVAEQHLLRSMYELAGSSAEERFTTRDELLSDRAWTPSQLDLAVRRAIQDELLVAAPDGRNAYALTDAGRAAARRVTRNHRLWELYLIAHADIAPSHVDRDADMVEHVLDPAMIDALEVTLARDFPDLAEPPSPHAIAAGARQPGGAR